MQARTPIIYSAKCLKYEYSWHVESPRRVADASSFLKQIGKYDFLEPTPASEEDLQRVHSMEWIQRVRRGGPFDGDTPGGDDICDYACLSAGGAILAAEKSGFSLMRPPGHHAGRNGRALGAPTLGFCYFNNIATAVKKLDKSTLILDIDGHHGNGTQEIFMKDPKVKYISLHRAGIYPGTGLVSEYNCINIAYRGEPGDAKYLEDLRKALTQVTGYDLVAISAGFDCLEGDLATLGLTTDCFREIGRIVRELGRRTFGVLEGGYGTQVGASTHALLQGLEST